MEQAILAVSSIRGFHAKSLSASRSSLSCLYRRGQRVFTAFADAWCSRFGRVLDENPEGVMLTVTESGFDNIPLARRAKAFQANEGGWGMMVQVIKKYVET